MDKTVIFSVAGSGKTSKIVESLDVTGRFLLLTYTDANRDNLRRKIIDRFGYFPENIFLYTYFKFLHGFCYKPFLRSKKNTNGITFRLPDVYPKYALTNERRYITGSRWLYANRLAKYLEQTGTMSAVVARIEKYFDAMFIDEVQDFAGHDFNFLISICKAKISCLLVGDFYQHTYDTSRDGNVNVNLHADYDKYRKRFTAENIKVDLTTLATSRRCSKSICDFITSKIGIPMHAYSERTSIVTFTDDVEVVRSIYENPNIVKLFRQEHSKYGCFSQNWGASKGLDHYHDVCVVLHPGGMQAWNSGSFHNINVDTKNKLYVACSRARGNLTFVPETLLKQYRNG